MSAPSAQDVYALIEPGNRQVAFHHARRMMPVWMTGADVDQIAWEVCGDLAARYAPQDGVPLAHYVGAAFPWHLYRRVKQAGTTGRSTRVWVFSMAQHDAQIKADQWGEPTDYALSVACAELLQAIPTLERQALWLCAVEGLSFTQAAAQMGVPRSTAFVLYKRAVAAARTFWEGAAA